MGNISNNENISNNKNKKTMETTFTITEETNKLLNILSDFNKVNERLFNWLSDEWGEESSEFVNRNTKLYEVHKIYKDFILEQIGDRITETMQYIDKTQI